jgi:poly-gamma-glutamate capsule biosynthesis protein CapA/YwtB (metallophosphatase superfamily)
MARSADSAVRWPLGRTAALVVAALAATGAAVAFGLGVPRASVAAPAPANPAPKKVPAVVAPPLAHTTAPKPDKPQRIVIVAGGDVNFGRECGQAILERPAYDPFEFVRPLWRDADVTFVNLESQLSEQGGETQSPRNRLIFTGPPGGAETLARAGIDVVSTANNHAWDYGRSALFETLDNLARAGVKKVGTGKTFEDAYAPAVLHVGSASVAVFAVTHIWNQGDFATHEGKNYVAWARLNLLRSALKKARAEHDVVLFSYHGGAEYIDAPPGPSRRFMESVMATGFVDAVIGHHPHVPQGVGWSKQGPIFYSLGNFVFAGHDWAPYTRVGYLARLEVGPERSLVARACPYTLDGHVPKPVGPRDARSGELREYLRGISTSVGGTKMGEPDERGCWELARPR